MNQRHKHCYQLFLVNEANGPRCAHEEPLTLREVKDLLSQIQDQNKSKTVKTWYIIRCITTDIIIEEGCVPHNPRRPCYIPWVLKGPTRPGIIGLQRRDLALTKPKENKKDTCNITPIVEGKRPMVNFEAELNNLRKKQANTKQQPGSLTYKEYKQVWSNLTDSQKLWVKHKCNWEHMDRWGVLQEWRVPEPHNLNSDGTWKKP